MQCSALIVVFLRDTGIEPGTILSSSPFTVNASGSGQTGGGGRGGGASSSGIAETIACTFREEPCF